MRKDILQEIPHIFAGFFSITAGVSLHLPLHRWALETCGQIQNGHLAKHLHP